MYVLQFTFNKKNYCLIMQEYGLLLRGLTETVVVTYFNGAKHADKIGESTSYKGQDMVG